MKQEQYIHIDEDGGKRYYKNKIMAILHREDGPAVELTDGGSKYWYINGELHRDDGPAIEFADGSKLWYINGKRHRMDGPAEYADGSKFWYINGKRHRMDGPAIEWADGSKEWWINGEHLTEEEFNQQTNPIVELTLEDIAAKFEINVSNLKIKK